MTLKKCLDDNCIACNGLHEHYLTCNHNELENIQPGAEDLRIAVKHDTDKVRLELLSPIAINEMAKVLTFGASKYNDHNWRKGFKWSRLLGAAARHLFAFIGGQDKDPETGLSHIAHLMCCAMFLLEHEETHKDLDDRYKGEK